MSTGKAISTSRTSFSQGEACQTVRSLIDEGLRADVSDHWYFTRPHNTATLEKLLDCFSTYPSPCPPRPLIISGWWYTAEVTTRGTSGEVIWQKGIMKFVDDLGLGFIAVGPYTNWITVAEMMPDV